MLYLEMLAQGVKQINQFVKIYRIISLRAKQNWKLGLFHITGPIPPHYHKIQRQIVVAIQGRMKVLNGDEVKTVSVGYVICFEPGILHGVEPLGEAQFLRVDLPGLSYRDDIHSDSPQEISPWQVSQEKEFPLLDSQYFGKKIDCGSYAAYELIHGKKTDNKWSVALLKIHDSPKHYHKKEREIFVVVDGALSIDVDDQNKIMNVGEYIIIKPGEIHHLKSAHKNPVRVLCFNFPAFDLADMHRI
jgi:quercetin dioxygenase-like cupin family protein